MENLNSEKAILIAEIGGNHEGSLSQAKDLLLSAGEHGADIVKFQSYSGEGLVNKNIRPERHKHFNNLMLKDEEWLELAEFANQAGICFSSSIWDAHYFTLLDEYISVYKVGSGDLNNFNLLRKFIETDKPLIISTAMANLDMVTRVYDYIQSNFPSFLNDSKLGILQCSAIYDNPSLSHVHLRAMDTLKGFFPCKIGFSNHAIGINPTLTAIARGAEIIEFHYTFNKENSSYRDHKLSFDKDDLILVDKFRNEINDILGNGNKHILDEEQEHISEFRRGVYLSRDLSKGDRVKEADLIFLRPEHGISMWKPYQEIIGRKAIKDIKSLEPLSFSFFEMNE